MAFPQVTSVTPSTSLVVNPLVVAMPAAVAAGDLLLMLLSNDADTTLVTPSGWTLVATLTSGVNQRGTVFAKVADGTEGGTNVDITASDNVDCAAHVYRITGWEGSITGVEASLLNAGADSTPDPPALNPAGWGIEDTLWVAVAFSAVTSITSYPTGYTNGTHTTTGAGASDASVSSARREAAVESEDPGIFTLSSGPFTVVGTVAVQPGTAPPDAPANPTATAISSSQIDVGWDDVATETSYRVERTTTFPIGWTDVSGPLAADTTSYSDTGLTANTEYFYRVVATNAAGDSSPSTVVSATTLAGGESNRMTGGAIRKPPRSGR